MNSLQQLLRSRSIAIVAGSGGVGKTTTSAALAIAGAMDGRKTLVVTIDPAKRLAQSLGLPEMGHEPQDLTPALRDNGLDPKGEMWGMMLDMKATLDHFITTVVRDPGRIERIFSNKIYQQVTANLSGSQEYAAMHKLQQLKQEGDFELIILDTPPTTHAMDFLRAPQRLTRFFGSGVVQLFTGGGDPKPGGVGFGLKILQKGGDLFVSAVERLVGKDLFSELNAFFEIVQSSFEPLKDHGDIVEGLLRSPQTEFIIVCGPQAGQIDEAVNFFKKVTELQISAGAIIVNRVVLRTMNDAQRKKDLKGTNAEEPMTKLDWVALYEALAAKHENYLKRVRHDVGIGRTYTVDAAPRDLHSLDGLRWIGHELFGDLVSKPK